jgi:hypothetical protein
VTTVKLLTCLHELHDATIVATSRPKTAGTAALAPVYGIGTGTRKGNATVASWSIAARKSMTVPAFHDRWPLCSTT